MLPIILSQCLVVPVLVATAVASAKLQDSSLLYTAVYPVFYVFYVLALEFGIFRIVKKHEDAYYNEKLKDPLKKY